MVFRVNFFKKIGRELERGVRNVVNFPSDVVNASLGPFLGGSIDFTQAAAMQVR